jgi:hypothetical protein
MADTGRWWEPLWKFFAASANFSLQLTSRPFDELFVRSQDLLARMAAEAA